ncbi:frizzled-9-like [Anneissia japonica]|uniref:frizzled-9-like n=1 Tax=Anneissia japonica TaxID=1529436 RepID=UPI00142572A5|nr:frizzled-9-like [Anneissia japonica]
MQARRFQIWILITTLHFSSCLSPIDENNRKCERVTIPMCIGIGYNYTSMPNRFQHRTQDEAAPKIHEFAPLVNQGCSDQLNRFLCSMFAPFCTEEYEFPIWPCRQMCEDVKAKCAPIMKSFNYEWPQPMDCEGLPVSDSNDRHVLCMMAPNTSSGNRPNKTSGVPSYPLIPSQETSDPKPNEDNPDKCENPSRFVYVKLTKSCAPRCNVDVFFRESDKKFAELWMGIWAVVCFFCTAVTVLTFFVDRVRFKYPERPIIFLSLCYNIYSIAYIVRLIAGSEAISCDENQAGEKYLIQEGLESTGCTIVFLIQYYFFMASSIWWVILTITWFLAAGMKWGYEAIAAHSSYYHLAAWATPALKTIIILTMRRVDGDELTGMCFVGNQDVTALTWFVLVPLFVYFFFGTFFILAGFFYLFRIRKVMKNMKNDGNNIDKLEKLMVRIGVFSVLYTVPATSVIACYFYQRTNFELWKVQSMNTTCIGDSCTLPYSIPSVPVLSVKLFMLLVIGITSGMWILSSKTINSWMKCCDTTFGFNQKKTKAVNHQAVAMYTTSPSLKTVIVPSEGHSANGESSSRAPSLQPVTYSRVPNPGFKTGSDII